MIRIEWYRGRRQYAVYEDDALLVVCCYRKGAQAVMNRIEQLQQRVAAAEAGKRIPSGTPPPGAEPWTA